MKERTKPEELDNMQIIKDEPEMNPCRFHKEIKMNDLNIDKEHKCLCSNKIYCQQIL